MKVRRIHLTSCGLFQYRYLYLIYLAVLTDVISLAQQVSGVCDPISRFPI